MKNGILFALVLLTVLAGQWLGIQWLESRVKSDNQYALQRQNAIYDQLLEIQQMLKRTDQQDYVYQDYSGALDRDTLQDMVATVIRQELATVEWEGSDPRKTADKRASNVDPRLSEQAYQESADIIAMAVANGRWQARDTETMTPLMDYLTEQQRVDLLEQFHQAFNRGEIELVDGVPPL
ncbi:hypothetical protein [Gynuella sunshinyii]|uniref:Uncharacterized protein n=1 Tax=Gynuella sunshinyii YC6258 TaxID=1445510 RepID=A0A0C5VUJ8_9GAMM|nr:hypothetical protein [Gynuella sunshinyii]AJQ96983.1 hypothetical Protein YC6258_04951 [Gynuella sunshinyii YC6258]